MPFALLPGSRLLMQKPVLLSSPDQVFWCSAAGLGLFWGRTLSNRRK